MMNFSTFNYSTLPIWKNEFAKNGATTFTITTSSIATLSIMIFDTWLNLLLVTIFFKLSLIKEGATEKVSQFILPLKSIYNKTFCLITQNVFFEIYRKVKSISIFLHRKRGSVSGFGWDGSPQLII
jgi:hypothetical protein